LVGGGDEGLCGTQASFQPPVQGPQGAVGTEDGLSCHAEGLGGTVTGFQRAAFQDLATRDLICGGQTKPATFPGLRLCRWRCNLDSFGCVNKSHLETAGGTGTCMAMAHMKARNARVMATTT